VQSNTQSAKIKKSASSDSPRKLNDKYIKLLSWQKGKVATVAAIKLKQSKSEIQT
jgi:hypothetical protein